MKITVIGATGLVGAAVVEELSKRGHQVKAIARNTDKVPDFANVTCLNLDVHSAELVDTLRGQDAIVSAFNPGWSDPKLASEFTRGYGAILAAVKEANIPYALVVGGAGSLYIAEGVQLVDTADFPSEIYPMANAARVLLSDLQERRDLNWAYISPAAMFGVNEINPVSKGGYRIGADEILLTDAGELEGITLADLAIAIVDDVETKKHLFQRFTAAN